MFFVLPFLKHMLELKWSINMGGLFFRQLIGVDGMVVRCGRASSMAQLAYTAVVCCVGGLLLLSLAKSGQDSHLVVGESVCVCECVHMCICVCVLWSKLQTSKQA